VVRVVGRGRELHFYRENNLKEDVIKLEGFIAEILPNTTYRVKLEEFDKIVIASLSGKMRKANIRVVGGDKVLLEFSPYDLTRGRITRRL
jgi:translation initiation factor IF-1